MRCTGADDAGVAGDGVFDLGVALGDLVGDGFEQHTTWSSISPLPSKEPLTEKTEQRGSVALF